MTRDEYLEQRVDDQISWYDKKSQANQNAFKRLRLAEIVLASAIPLLAGYMETGTPVKLAVGLIGLLVAVIAGVLTLYHFHENWTEYRVTCEGLKHEKFLFLTGAAPYNNPDDTFPLFVQRVESLISKEHSDWAQYVRPDQGENAT